MTNGQIVIRTGFWCRLINTAYLCILYLSILSPHSLLPTVPATCIFSICTASFSFAFLFLFLFLSTTLLLLFSSYRPSPLMHHGQKSEKALWKENLVWSLFIDNRKQRVCTVPEKRRRLWASLSMCRMLDHEPLSNQTREVPSFWIGDLTPGTAIYIRHSTSRNWNFTINLL